MLPGVTQDVADRHLPYRGMVVRADHVDERAILARLDRHQGDRHGVDDSAQFDLDVDILPWPQRAVVVGQQSLGGDGAGARIDAAVDEAELAGSLARRAVVKRDGDRHDAAVSCCGT